MGVVHRMSSEVIHGKKLIEKGIEGRKYRSCLTSDNSKNLEQETGITGQTLGMVKPVQ